MLSARLAVVVSSVLFLAACASAGDARDSDRDPDPVHVGEVSEGLTAQCTANVIGHGVVDVETVYLPDVVHCENGGAPLESLKAQAIAARTYLYYKLETSSSISDGQGDQVFSCGSHAGALEKQAVAETAGMILRYQSTTIAAFFVAGGNASPPACHDSSSSTSGDVTYNAGKSGNGIEQTPLGFVSPSNLRNRGCMSQLGSRCLADEGNKADAILKFYYGDDISITEATGPCVPMAPAADAGNDGASRDAATLADGGAGAAGEGSVADDAGGGGARVGTSSTTGAPVEEHGSADPSGCSATGAPRDANGTTPAGWAIMALGATGLVVGRRRARARAVAASHDGGTSDETPSTGQGADASASSAKDASANDATTAPEPDIDAIPWDTGAAVGTGIAHKSTQNPRGASAAVLYAGFGVDLPSARGWATAMYRAQLRDRGVSELWAVQGPNLPAYTNEEIGNSKLAAALVAKVTPSTKFVLVLGHSSGSFVAHELLGQLAGGLDPANVTADRVVYFDLDGGQSGLTAPIAARLRRRTSSHRSIRPPVRRGSTTGRCSRSAGRLIEDT